MDLNRRKFIKYSATGLLGVSALDLEIFRDRNEGQEYSMVEMTYKLHKEGFS